MLGKFIFIGFCLAMPFGSYAEESNTPLEETPIVEKNQLRDPQFENDLVRVWKSTITADQPVQMHRHNASKIVVVLKGGVLHRIEQAGAISDIIFDTGKAYWIDADPPNALHADVNASHEPIEVMVIEFKGP
jgi:quercetin dioxygenase-like cupin family protein